MADKAETDILSLSNILNEYCKDLKLIYYVCFILNPIDLRNYDN